MMLWAPPLTPAPENSSPSFTWMYARRVTTTRGSRPSAAANVSNLKLRGVGGSELGVHLELDLAGCLAGAGGTRSPLVAYLEQVTHES